MKLLTSILCILLTFNGFAQEEFPTLTISGKSELIVKPTRTIISFTISSVDSTYTKSVEKLITRVDILSKVLIKIKFDEKEIITSNFKVNKNFTFTKGSREENGYKASQTIKIQFEQNKKRLLEVLNKTTSSKAEPTIDIAFGLDKNRKSKLKAELIKLAVKDAKIKAEIIAKEAGYKIVGIKDITYSRNHFQSNDLYITDESVEEEIVLDLDIEISNFEVENLTFSESVSIVYNIVKL